MKQYIIAILVLLTMSAVFAQNINSFRNLGSAGALDGDLEYAFDPIDLNCLSGTHIFSGLSNMYAKDQLFDNISEQYLLLGASTEQLIFKNLKAAVLFSFVDSETPLPITYYTDTGLTTATAYGNVESRINLFYDSNNNGLYDRERMLYQKYRNTEADKNSDFFLVLSGAISPKLLLGYKLGLIQANENGSAASFSGTNFNAGDPTGEELWIITNLPEMDFSVDENELKSRTNADFSNEIKQNKLQNQFALMKKGEKWNFSAYYTLNLLQNKNLIEDKIQLSEEENDEPDFVDREEIFFQEQSKGLENILYVRAKHTLNQEGNYLNNASLALGVGFKHKYLKNELEQKDDLDEISYLASPNVRHKIETTDYEYETDLNGLGFLANLKLRLPLNQSTIIGLGAQIEADKSTQKGDYSTIYDYDNRVYTSADEDDWISGTSASSKESGELKIENSSNKITVPVGLEYWFTNNMKWALRCGSRFTRIVSVEKYMYSPTLIEPLKTDVYYSDGTHTTTFEPVFSSMENTSRKDVNNYSDLSYGLCFKANKNLQIELINMFEDASSDLWNTRFIKSLKLSFSLMF